jgi:lysozyme family protein
MADFEKVYALTMQAEGGYANHPKDKGGEACKGISRKHHPNWIGWKTIDAVKQTYPAKLDDALKTLPGLQALIAPFYKVNYWDCNRTGSINDQQLANQVFDTAVNCGTGTAAKLLQKAAQVTVDLQVGPQTIAAVNNSNPEATYTAFITSNRTITWRL